MLRLAMVLLVTLAAIIGGDALARHEPPNMVGRAGPRIDRVDIIEKGIFHVVPKPTQDHQASPAGSPRVLAGVVLIANTTVIKPAIGIHFGIRYRIRGYPRGARVPIRIVHHYPIAGLKNPHNQKPTYTYQQTSMKVVGNSAYEGYHLSAPWELVPGIWSFEIWHEGRLLAEQEFELTAH